MDRLPSAPSAAGLLRGVAATTAALLTSFGIVSGECPVASRPCEALSKADLVFYGEVLAATAPRHGNQKVTFRVLRPFKGVREERFTGDFRITSKSLYFVAGERRVVYASSQAGRWSTDCARTAVLMRAADQEITDLTRCKG
jgi:hypothetical protein